MTWANTVYGLQDDRERMATFYKGAFGWQTRMLGPEMGNYVLATTTINGGFYARKSDWPAQYPSLVIAVDDIRAAMKKVVEPGGKVLGEPMQIPGIGQYVSFLDTEDNRVSMLQPMPRARHDDDAVYRIAAFRGGL